MARNEVFKHSDWISLPVPADTPSGEPVHVGGLNGITQTAEGEGGNDAGWASCALTGAWNVTVTGAIANVGDPVHIEADGDLVATATGNKLWGHALATKAAAAGVIPVRIADHSHGAEA